MSPYRLESLLPKFGCSERCAEIRRAVCSPVRVALQRACFFFSRSSYLCEEIARQRCVSLGASLSEKFVLPVLGTGTSERAISFARLQRAPTPAVCIFLPDVYISPLNDSGRNRSSQDRHAWVGCSMVVAWRAPAGPRIIKCCIPMTRPRRDTVLRPIPARGWGRCESRGLSRSSCSLADMKCVRDATPHHWLSSRSGTRSCWLPQCPARTIRPALRRVPCLWRHF